MQPTKFYIGVMGFFLAALVFGVIFFVIGMGDATYLVNDGVGYGLRYIDKPSYDSHLQGLIFVVSFLGAGMLLLVLMVLPDQPGVAASLVAAAPQPRRRQAAAPQPAAPAPAQQVAAPAQPATTPAPEQTAPAPGIGTVEIETVGQEPTPVPAETEEEAPSVEEEVLTDPVAQEIAKSDLPESRYEDTGEDDVVYGNGRVTDDSVWEFIHTYPDSAVKFLYRKTLDNKALTPNEEDIYRRWELRGMTRSKVRQFVLEIMGWKSLPDDFPHNIWRKLRDQIFEMKSQTS